IVLHTAWEFGIRYFDAARSYGKAEQFLSSWFTENDIPANEVAVGSKWGYTYTADWQVEADEHEIKEHSVDVLQRQWAETQENIGPYLNLYQIHSATQSSGVLENDAVLEELFRLKRAGTLIGLSLSGTAQGDTLMQALDVKDNGTRLFDAVQATWNILERSAEPALTEAHHAGLGIIVKEALANGRLTVRSAANPDFAEQYRVIMGQAGRLGTSVDALSTAAVLAQPWADIVLSGAASRVHLISNIAAINVPFDDEAAAALQDVTEDPDAYWQTRSALAWN
ncbi:MAG: aldo/keto reductase, partial [Chloroflexota bacterium]